MVEDASRIEVDKITEVLIGGIWHPVSPGTLSMIRFALSPDAESVPGIGFQTGPRSVRRNKEAIYVPLSSVEAVKTMDDARTQHTEE